MRFIVFDKNGEILRYGDAPKHLVPKQALPGEFVTTGKGTDETHFVNTKFRTLAPKMGMDAVINKDSLKGDGLDSVMISGLPTPSKIKINETVYENPDPDFEFTVNFPGEYKVTCSSIKFLDKNFLVTANENQS